MTKEVDAHAVDTKCDLCLLVLRYTRLIPGQCIVWQTYRTSDIYCARVYDSGLKQASSRLCQIDPLVTGS